MLTAMDNIHKATELLYFVSGVGIDTDHGEYYDLDLDSYVLRAESLLWDARVENPSLSPAWAWCFEHSYPGGWRDEDGARAAYFVVSDLMAARHAAARRAKRTRQFLYRERKRSLKSAFLS